MEAQTSAMAHGVECEGHAVATICSIILPFLFPGLVFHEEGIYTRDNIGVSPDGTLRDPDSKINLRSRNQMSNTQWRGI